MISTIITIDHPAGLHARPAAQFVKTAARFPCKISVRKLNSEKPPANAKSPLSVLTLGVNQGDTVEIIAEGEEAQPPCRRWWSWSKAILVKRLCLRPEGIGQRACQNIRDYPPRPV